MKSDEFHQLFGGAFCYYRYTQLRLKDQPVFLRRNLTTQLKSRPAKPKRYVTQLRLKLSNFESKLNGKLTIYLVRVSCILVVLGGYSISVLDSSTIQVDGKEREVSFQVENERLDQSNEILLIVLSYSNSSNSKTSNKSIAAIKSPSQLSSVSLLRSLMDTIISTNPPNAKLASYLWEVIEIPQNCLSYWKDGAAVSSKNRSKRNRSTAPSTEKSDQARDSKTVVINR